MKVMKEKVMKLFEEGYEVVFGSYYGEDVAEDMEDIEYGFEDEESEWVSYEIEIDEKARRVTVWVENDE